ncbi:MAG: 50S ribosomal protein L18 [Bacteroidetes bacterium]|nr:50S ribosomal protein L18 [Bacteroidota bacterium]
MNTQAAAKKRRIRIKRQIRKKVSGTAETPRLVVYRSLNGISAQLINDLTGTTITSVSSKGKDSAAKLKDVKGKTGKSKEMGKALAEAAKSKNITKVVFDRNGYLYHGRVKAFAEGAREGGLIF